MTLQSFVDKVIQERVFESDAKLTTELMKAAKNDTKSPEKIGMILVSPNTTCKKCALKLYIRPDRSTSAIVYDHQMGTIPAIHYMRYCRKKGCSFQQHYSYYTCGSSDHVTYNDDALDLPYFMCSRETGFSANLLKHFDSDCLLGQISYKQSAEIYNHYNEYEDELNSDSQQPEDTQ